MGKFIDITGQRFNRLLVLKLAGKDSEGKLMWLCRCDCGAEKVFNGNAVKRGHTKSCGCYKSDVTKLIMTKHGESRKGSAEYTAWKNIKSRCFNKNAHNYSYYGGRGISVSDSWVNSFDQFLKDMGPRPGPDYSIERIDNDRGYGVGNCKWATRTEQGNNRRSNVILTLFGETLTISQVCRKYDISPETLRSRLSKGLTPEQAATLPKDKATKLTKRLEDLQ